MYVYFFLFLYIFTDAGLVFMNGFAVIFLGLVSFGLLHSKVNERLLLMKVIYLFMASLSPSISRHGNGDTIQLLWIH